ncbi:MAG: thioredoxin family protein [Chloroflexota bacterium]
MSTTYTLVVKEDCPTCTMLGPVYEQLLANELALSIYTQDNPAFPLPTAIDDRELEKSFRLDIETVPTLIKYEDGVENGRLIGWHRENWEALTSVIGLGESLPAMKPGCGALNVMPGIAERLQIRYGDSGMSAREIEVAPLSDPVEVAFERGWTDGLPVVTPTPERVWRMLQGTSRRPDEVVGIIPPDLTACTVEKVAINAVMAGCKPEYMPVVLAAVEAACIDEFNMHGLLATTYFSSPIVVVNGPIAQKIGMNSGGNALGQGNRANATIGRALQLVIRNVAGGKPGGVDRATLGYPGKYTFCFAEREQDSPWESLAVQKGFAAEDSTVTLIAGGGVHGVMDQLSRTPEGLTHSFAKSLLSVAHYKIAFATDALLVVSPEHARTFKNAGWSKEQLAAKIQELTTRHGSEMVRGADDNAEGLPPHFAGATLSKFRPGGLHIVHAGGTAGMFSAIIGGWVNSGARGSSPVTVKINS